MGSFTSALSSASSAASGWTMLVFPALAFAAGLIHLWTAVSIALGHWLVWTVMARRLRRYTIAADDSLTLPEFLEKRFADRTGTLRTLSAFITIFFIVFYVSSGLISGAKLLEVVFDLTHEEFHSVGVLVTLVAITTYTFIGGFLAVSRTDVFQSLMMLAGFAILPALLIFMVDEPFQGLGATATGFWNPFTDENGNAVGLVFLLSTAGWGLGTLGSQRVLARLMALDREDQIPRTRNVSVSWVVLMFGFGLLLGLVAVPALAEGGMLDLVMQDPERVYLITSTSLLPSPCGRPPANRRGRSRNEHCRLPATARLGGRYRRHTLLQSPGLRGTDPLLRLDWPRHASGSRADLRRPLHPSSGLRIHPSLPGLGRHGRGLRSGNPPRPLLAPLQLLGRADLHLGRHRSRNPLVVPPPGRRLNGPNPGPLRPVGSDEDRPRRRLEHPTGHPRLPHRHPCGSPRNPAHPGPAPGDGGPLRPGQLRLSTQHVRARRQPPRLGEQQPTGSAEGRSPSPGVWGWPPRISRVGGRGIQGRF